MFIWFSGKITLLDLGNNDIGPKGAFHVANYIKKTKSLLWLNLYMNDIGDEVYKEILLSISYGHFRSYSHFYYASF